jgi:thiol-disulfide isomerase/thioredoxin
VWVTTTEKQMPHTIPIGPVVLPVALLFMFLATFLAGYVGKKTSDSPAEVESVLWQALLLGLVASRMAFVLEYVGSYSAAPLSIFDIRDGGWRPVVGFAAAWLFIAWRQIKRQRLRKPLMWAALTGTIIWGTGLIALELPQQEQQKVPSLALIDLNGSRVDLTQFGGKPLVVNLWATWCPPCVREMPVLHEAQVGNPMVNFVFINQGETSQRVESWLSARGLPLQNVLLDSKGEALAAFKQRGLPTTLFFNAEGRLVGSRTGELSKATLAEELRSISND